MSALTRAKTSEPLKRMGLDELKTLPGLVHPLTQKECYSFSLLPRGVPRSGLVEISAPHGLGKTEVVLQFLNENPNLKVAWIEKDFTVFPSAFSAYRVKLDRVLFIDLSAPSTQHSPIWCATQVLKSQLFQLLILAHFTLQEVELRRLQLLSKQSGSLIFLLHTQPLTQKSWPLSLQIQIHRFIATDAPILTVLKERGNFSL